MLLQTALEAYDRMKEAAAAIDELVQDRVDGLALGVVDGSVLVEVGHLAGGGFDPAAVSYMDAKLVALLAD